MSDKYIKIDTGIEDYESPDENYKKILIQIDYEERLDTLFLEMREFVEYATIPLLQSLNQEKLSDFLNPNRAISFLIQPE